MNTPNPLTRGVWEIYSHDANRNDIVVARVTASKWGDAVRAYANEYHSGIKAVSRNDRFMSEIVISGVRYFARREEV
jgi:hypothetical protein